VRPLIVDALLALVNAGGVSADSVEGLGRRLGRPRAARASVALLLGLGDASVPVGGEPAPPAVRRLSAALRAIEALALAGLHR
jgi:hypothetical protein